MKKIFTTLSIVAIAATTVKAQDKKTSKVYVRAGVGYAFPHAGAPYVSETSVSFMSATRETKKYSFGAGMNVAVAGGFWINRHLGLELGVNAGIAPKKFESSYSDPATSYTSGNIYAKMPVYVIPAVVLQTGGENLNVYSRLGVAVNVAGKAIIEGKGAIDESEQEVSFRTGVGFQGALGVSVPAGKRLSIYLEANGISMNQDVKRIELTQYTISGVDQLPSMSTSEKVIEYDNSVTATLTPDPDQPSKNNTFSMPFSNIGITAGVIFKL